MRIAYVCTDPGVPVFGRKGASVHVQAVLRELLRGRHEVHLLATRLGGDHPHDLAGVHVHPLPLQRAPDPAVREERVQRADAETGAVLDRLQAPCRLDLVYERYSLWGRTATAWAADHRVDSVLEVNAPLVQEQAAHRVLLDRAGAEAVATAAMSAAGAVVCVTDAVARWARGHARDPGRVHTLGNGVDTARVRPAPRRPLQASGTAFTIGFVGTLKPWHGVETLVDATAALVARDPTYRLLVVGDGPLAASLHARARGAGVGDRVETTGAVDPSDVPALLHRMDVAVAPYPALDDFYFSPLKVYEYLAAGLPVVASAVGDLPMLLDHGALGTLVPPGDVTALADAISALRADPARRAALGRAARRQAVARHDWSQVVTTALSLASTGSPASDGRLAEVSHAGTS